MDDHQQIIETIRPFAHRTDVERVEEAVQALRPFSDEAVKGLADALDDQDDYQMEIPTFALDELKLL